MSIKAFKFRISANKTTTEKLQWVLDRCRELYNASLQERRDAYLRIKQHPNYYDEETRKQLTHEHAIEYYEQKRELVGVKEERPEYQDIASHVLQDVMMRLQKAFDDFFGRIKNGKTPGYPRFQGKNRYDSFTYVRHEVAPFERIVVQYNPRLVSKTCSQSLHASLVTAGCDARGNAEAKC
jgi:putative transposase